MKRSRFFFEKNGKQTNEKEPKKRRIEERNQVTQSNSGLSQALSEYEIKSQSAPPFYFSQLCHFFENLSIRKKKEKENYFLKFLEEQKRNFRSIFPIMRLMCPELDHTRKQYGLKENKLIEIYTKVMQFSQSEIHSLSKWKSTIAGVKLKKGSTNFSDAVAYVLSERGFEKYRKEERTGYTIKEINQWLDELSQKDNKMESLLEMFQKIIPYFPYVEQKWIIRILIKDMRMGARGESILKMFHQDALDLFNTTSSLEYVCKKVQELKNRHTRLTKKICPFQIVKPMLAISGQSKKKSLSSVINIKRDPYIVEEKFDGDRMLIHFNFQKPNSDGRKIMYHTRNSNDVTERYCQEFDPIVKKACKNMKSGILDGEMLTYNKLIKEVEKFGGNRTHTIEKNPNKNMLFKCFDILYYNGSDTTQYSLEKRKKLLNKKIISIPTYFEVVQHQRISSIVQVDQLLEEAILSQHEGIMIKNYDSHYGVGKRNKDWIKVKPFNRITFDCLIIGGFYGTKFGTRQISHFLCGLSRNRTALKNDLDNPEFVSFVKVGSGYNKTQLDLLQNKLKDHWKIWDDVPSFLCGWKPPKTSTLGSGGLKYIPSHYIEPKHSVILEVSAQEITETEKYNSSYTLRFAHCKRIRLKKDWFEADDCNDLKTKWEDYHNNPSKISISSGIPTLEGENPKRKQGGRFILPSQFMDTDTSNVILKKPIFQGKEFVVLNTKNPEKEKLEKLIVEYGGTKSQTRILNKTQTYAFIAQKKCQKVINRINNEKYNKLDIIKPKWILECIEAGKMLPLRPRHLFHSSPETKELFKKDIDEFGDIYDEDLDERKLKRVFRKARRVMKKEGFHITLSKIERINEKYKFKLPFQFFRDIIVYLDLYEEIGNKDTALEISPLELTEIKLKGYGSNIETTVNSLVTHIIVNPEDTSRIEELYEQKSKETQVVSYKWINKCIKKRKAVDVTDFIIDPSSDVW